MRPLAALMAAWLWFPMCAATLPEPLPEILSQKVRSQCSISIRSCVCLCVCVCHQDRTSPQSVHGQGLTYALLGVGAVLGLVLLFYGFRLFKLALFTLTACGGGVAGYFLLHHYAPSLQWCGTNLLPPFAPHVCSGLRPAPAVRPRDPT